MILLVGKNGSGKSSILNSFDYVLYGKCRGKKKKWTTLSTLPNRINGELLNRIKFQSLGTEIEIRRGISPNVLELFENGNLNDRSGKSNLDDKIEDYIGMDIETFKSFISMSIDDFKNFISLSSEEKQLLLDKLFNLEVINILNNILKELNKSNKIRLSALDSEISTLEDSITSIRKSIDKSIQKEKENIESEVETIKAEMDSKKDEYRLIKDKIDKIQKKDEEISSEIDNEKSQFITITSEIKSIQKDIDLYDSGKCPTCATDFHSDHFTSLRLILVDKKKSVEDIKLIVEKNIFSLKEKKQKLNNLSFEANKSFNDLNLFLRECKSKLDKLMSKKDNQDIVDISEFEKSIKEFNNRKKISQDNISIGKDREVYYKELAKIFGEDGVKKSIIAGIIKPIIVFNHHLFQYNLEETIQSIFSKVKIIKNLCPYLPQQHQHYCFD